MLVLHTRSQWPKDNSLQNVYMAISFVIFGTKSLFRVGKFVHNINESQILLKWTKFSLQTYTNFTFCTPFVPNYANVSNYVSVPNEVTGFLIDLIKSNLDRIVLLRLIQINTI
jgi:hypothetical protein